MSATSANATSNNLMAGVYRFRLRYQEWGGGEGMVLNYAPPSSATYNAISFSTNITYNYRPIIKLDANDLAYRQGLSVNSTIATWSNNGIDGTLRHASGFSANSSTLSTLTSDANGFMVNFDRTKQQYFSIGNLEFDQFISSDAVPNSIKGLTIFVVAKLSLTDVGTWERIFDFGLGSSSGNMLVARYSNTNRIAITLFNTTSNILQRHWNNTIDGAFHVYAIVVTNASPLTIALYVDNQLMSTGINNDVTIGGPLANRTTTINYIGRSNWNGDSYFTGTIRELLIFREVVDNQTISRMNNYLMYKWGIRAFMPPVTSGLIGLYTGESWTGTRWTDLSGSGNHATTIRGTISTSTLNSLTTLTGATTAGLRFPSTILPSTYTLFHVTKYNGSTRGRIIDGYSGTVNWLSGFHSSKSGVAYHGNTGSWMTGITDLHGLNWVISTDQKNVYRSQGVSRTNAGFSTGVSDLISINHGDAVATEPSDWACACVIVYNRELTTNEIVQVETFLNRRYSVF
jgi:hypothetical protein